MWSDLNTQEKLDVKHTALAWVIAFILVPATVWAIASLVYAEPYKAYVPECTDLYKLTSSPNTCDHDNRRRRND